MAKDPVNTQIDFDKIDPRAHRRVLRFINAANSPEDLLVAPNDRRVVDEEQEHIDFEEHAPDQRQVLAPDQAAAIIEARDRVSPVQGFAHLKDAIAVNPALAGLLLLRG